MTKTLVLLFALAMASALAARAEDHVPGGPETVVVQSGTLKLHALLWHPGGHGPFPAVLFNHGSGNTPENQAAQAAAVGPVFAKHGYVLLFVYRRGSGLSADQGTSAVDLMDRELATHGQDARNKLQLELLQTDQLSDALAGLAFLRALPEVDTHRVAVAGHSFGASLTLLIAERDSALRAAIAFSGSTASWEHSPQLRARLIAAVGRTTVPIFFIEERLLHRARQGAVCRDGAARQTAPPQDLSTCRSDGRRRARLCLSESGRVGARRLRLFA